MICNEEKFFMHRGWYRTARTVRDDWFTCETGVRHAKFFFFSSVPYENQLLYTVRAVVYCLWCTKNFLCNKIPRSDLRSILSKTSLHASTLRMMWSMSKSLYKIFALLLTSVLGCGLLSAGSGYIRFNHVDAVKIDPDNGLCMHVYKIFRFLW